MMGGDVVSGGDGDAVTAGELLTEDAKHKKSRKVWLSVHQSLRLFREKTCSKLSLDLHSTAQPRTCHLNRANLRCGSLEYIFEQ
jgi:hypothetical protein